MAKKRKKLSKKEKAQISDIIWQARQHCRVYQYEIDWVEVDEDEDLSDGEYMLAQVITEIKYLKATIHLYPRNIKHFREDKERFIKNIYHEVAHIIMEPMKDWAMSQANVTERPFLTDLNEQATETIARIAYGCREAEAKLEKSEGKHD